MFHTGAKGIKVQHHHARIPIDEFKTEQWVNISINVLSFVKHCYQSKSNSFNFRSLDSIMLKGHMLVRKIFTMRDSLQDSDMYEDPDSYRIDEVPKTLQYASTVPYVAQVITSSRVAESNSESTEDTKSESEQNTTQQSERNTKYKYAFGSRVKNEESFDKGLGVIGVGRTTDQKFAPADDRINTSESNRSKATKKRTTGGLKSSKIPKKVVGKVPKPKDYPEEEIKSVPVSAKKEYTEIEKDHINQKSKLDQQKNLISKEEDKLEIIRKKRKELFSNPFKHIGKLLQQP